MKDNRKKAFLYILLSSLSFSFMSLFVKTGSDILFIHKVFFRQLVTFILVSVILAARRESFRPESAANLKLLVIRSLAGLAGVFLYFYSIANLSLSDSAMLNKLSPFFVILAASIILKEKIRLSSIPLMIAAFAGALLIIKPQFNYTVLPALAGTAGSVFAGVAYSVVRMLKNRENPYKVIFYFSGISVLLVLFPALLQFRFYSVYNCIILLLIGVFATGGQYFLTLGFQSYRAGEISLVTYSQILFSLFLGLFFFSELPDLFSVAGGLLITGSAAVLYLKKTD